MNTTTNNSLNDKPRIVIGDTIVKIKRPKTPSISKNTRTC